MLQEGRGDMRRDPPPQREEVEAKTILELGDPKLQSPLPATALCRLHLSSSSCRRRLSFSFCMFLETATTSLWVGGGDPCRQAPRGAPGPPPRTPSFDPYPSETGGSTGAWVGGRSGPHLSPSEPRPHTALSRWVCSLYRWVCSWRARALPSSLRSCSCTPSSCACSAS